MSDDTYRGKPIAEMTPDELRAALVACMRYARALHELHAEHVNQLRHCIQRDDTRQQQLFTEHAE